MFDWLIPTTRNTPNSHSIRMRLQSDPYYRLQSAQEIAIAAELGIKIDVNLATVDDWLRSLVELAQIGVQFCCIEDIAAALGVSVQRLKPLQPILSFCYYAPESDLTPQPINPNTASLEQLTQIPAIDLFLARVIVENRQEGGAYRNLADLQRRLSLSPQLLTDLMYYLRF
jgi:DNA uptake protein ComE-like DNA-binding protein